MTSLLVPLQRCGIGDAPAVGRTAAVLGELRADGFAIPDGVVLIPAAGMLSDAGLAGLLRDVVGLIGAGRYAVRSSEIGEELGGAPEAGREASVFDVEADGLVAAVRSCWASAAERVRRRDGGGHVAVLVQGMVAATAVGAAVTAVPVTGDRGSVRVSAAVGQWGMRAIDEVFPDEWVVRGGRAICRRSLQHAVDAATVLGVAELARRVEKRLGGPQDIEWAVEDGRVVLLGARPSAVPPEPIAVPIEVPEGFWERDASHSPRPWTPMLGSVFFDIRDAALREVFETFGLLVETLEFRQIGGWEYARLVPLGGKDRAPPPSWLMPLVTRIVPVVRKRVRACVAAVRDDVAGAMIDRWYGEWQPDLVARAAALRSENVSVLEDEALTAHTGRALSLLHDGCRRHFLLQGAFGFPVAELVFILEELLGWLEGRTFRLLTGLSVVSTRPAYRLGQIARRAAAHPRLRDLLVTGVPQLDAVRAVAPEIADAVDAHIAEFGQRALSFEIADPSIAELPASTLRLLVDFARRGYDPEGHTSALAAARAEATAEARALLSHRPAAVRERFERALARAQRAYPVREDNEFSTFGVPMALLRRAVLEHGVRLVERNVLGRRDDVFWLTLPQASAALRTASPQAAPATAPAVRAEVARSVARARGERAWIEQHRAPATYGHRPAPPPALDALPAEARFALRAMMWTVESILAPGSSNRVTSPRTVSGIPAVSGRYTGRVRIVRDETQLGRIRPGDVLVCPVAAPVWSVVLPIIGALVTDSGGLLSHSAIIAREYRIPAVVATGSGTSTLRDDQVVTVDGTTGQIEVVS
jgi:pyruvate,water dikinase